LQQDDWQQLQEIYDALKPFWRITLRIQRYASQGSHGVIWEVLPAFEWLLSHVEKQAAALNRVQRGRQQNPLLTSYQNAWEVLQKYNNITDEH
jgi:hypothetical protein